MIGREPGAASPPSRSSAAIKAALLAIVIAGAALGAVFYGKIKNSPERIIAEMEEEMSEVKTFSGDISVEIKAAEKGKPPFSLTAASKSDIDRTKDENQKSEGNLKITLAAGGISFDFSIDYRSIGEESYLKIVSSPPLPFLAPLAAMGGQWVKMDEKSLLSMYPEEMREELEKKAEENRAKQKEMKEKAEAAFKKVLAGKKVYSFRKELAEEEVNGRPARHYLVAFDKAVLKDLIVEMYGLAAPEMEAEIKTGVVPAKEEFAAELGEFLDKIGEINAEIWIGKKEKYLYRTKFSKEIDFALFDSESEGTFSVSADITLSEFNKPLKIVPPEEYKALDEILGPLFRSSPGAPPVESPLFFQPAE